MKYTNVDFHCDLLSYFLYPNTGNKDEIGCSLPYLEQGKVCLQVMAIYAATGKESVENAFRQVELYQLLSDKKEIFPVQDFQNIILEENKVKTILAVENASCICDEDENLNAAFQNIEKIIKEVGNIAYLSITHHDENRFGGGNNTDVGLKGDGKFLIDFLVEKQIPIDLSHTSDVLAEDILNYCEQKNHKINLLASHSNSRAVYEHNRNLPDDLITEIINRNGVIGLNFVKDFIHPNQPNKLYHHINHFLELGAENCLVYGADFFYDAAHPDKSRYPFFFDEFKNALCYNPINDWLNDYYGETIVKKISHKNALRFFSEIN